MLHYSTTYSQPLIAYYSYNIIGTSSYTPSASCLTLNARSSTYYHLDSHRLLRPLSFLPPLAVAKPLRLTQARVR